MITHSVFFSLKYAQGSVEEAAFFKKAMNLSSIPSVKSFECVRQVSSKNQYKLGLIMKFEDQAGFDLYNEHSDHQNFVKNIWSEAVEEFIELDYVILREKTIL